MKNTTKYLLSGILASSFVLSVAGVTKETTKAEDYLKQSTALAMEYAQSAKAEGIEDAIQLKNEQPAEIYTLSVASYDAFYSQYGYEKSATVFYNGTELPFDTAFPLIDNGTTFVPLATLANSIGAEITYIQETHSVGLVYKGETITFDIGSTKYAVNGVTASEELPYATYIANDSTMVPLRFVTDAFGLDIYWNGSNKQVVIVDSTELKEGISENYTLMDALLAYTNNEVEGQNGKITGDFLYDISKDGKLATLDAGVTALTNTDLSAMSYEMECAVDLTEFEEEITDLLNSMSAYPSDANMVNLLLDSLKNFNLNYIYDMENLVMYFQSDLIANLLPALNMNGLSLNIDQDTWFQFSMTDFLLDSEVETMRLMMNQFSGQGSVSTVEELVDTLLDMCRYQDNSTTDLYGTAVAVLYYTSDDKFDQKGNVYTLSNSVYDGNQEISYELVLNTDGKQNIDSFTADFDFLNSDIKTFSIGQDTQDSMSVSLDGSVFGFDVTCQGELFVEYTTETAAAKPTGNNIFDLSSMF